MMMRALCFEVRGLWTRGFLIGVLTVSVACQRHADPSTDFGATAAATAGDSLPPMQLRDDTPNLLLTWLGPDGDFHVVEKIADVPAEHRQQVRVVQTNEAAGTGALVYVANLGEKRPDGTYGVTTMQRSDWEKLGADLRKTRLEALAPGHTPPAADAAQPSGGTGNDSSAAISAIVYGADWCKPCHDAERYLRSLGVSVTKKNIEESRAAQAEMREKLARVHRTGSGIPVIDVMGKIFVGYSPGPLKQAVDAARHATAANHG
jgi:glutaredoxin